MLTEREENLIRLTDVAAYWYHVGAANRQTRSNWGSPAAFACAHVGRTLRNMNTKGDPGVSTEDAAFCCSVVTGLQEEWCLDFVVNCDHENAR